MVAKTPELLRLYVDGASRGNPGPAAAGVVIADADGQPLIERGLYLGQATNNVAEYRGLLAGLELAESLKPQRLEIFSDSELMVRQITGEYRVKNAGLRPLFEEAQTALLRLESWQIRHIPRAKNARADKLANLALDRKGNVEDADPDEWGRRASAADDGIEETPTGPTVVARVTLGCDPRTCPATVMVDELFRIGPEAPAGLCIHAAAAILPEAIRLLDADEPSKPGKPVSVLCPRCSARFELRRGEGLL